MIAYGHQLLRKNWQILLLGFVFIALRLINIASEEYWVDEYYNLLVAYRLSPVEIVSYVKHIHHPPFYYLLLHPWLSIFGIGEFFGRLPSLLFSLLSFILILKITKLFIKDWVVEYSVMFLYTFSAFNVEYSQEGRPYTLMLLEYLVIFYLVLKGLKEKRVSIFKLFFLFIVCVLALYTHYDLAVYLFALVSSLIVVLLINRRNFKIAKKLIAAILVSFLPFLLWFLPYLTSEITLGAYEYLVSKGNSIIFLINATVNFSFIYFNKLLFAASILIILITFALIINRWKSISGHKLLPFLIIVLLNSFVFIYLSPLSRIYSYTWQRHIIILHSLWLIFISIFVWDILKSMQIRVKMLLFVSVFLLNSASLGIVLKNDSGWFYNHQYRNLVEFIENHENVGDLILIPRVTFETMVLRFYGGENRVTTTLNSDVDINGLPTIESADISFYRDKDYKDIRFKEGLSAISQENQRIWVINNYTEEDNFAYNFFRANEEWNYETVEDFPNNRLWLLTKRN